LKSHTFAKFSKQLPRNLPAVEDSLNISKYVSLAPKCGDYTISPFTHRVVMICTDCVSDDPYYTGCDFYDSDSFVLLFANCDLLTNGVVLCVEDDVPQTSESKTCKNCNTNLTHEKFNSTSVFKLG